MNPQLSRELAYDDWLADLAAAYPGCEVLPTHYGAEIRDADGYVIAEPDYDGNEPDEAAFHY
jgi:hypothetical protein